MAVVRPLYNNAGDIQEMSDAQIDELKQHITYLYYLNPGVNLSVVNSGGNLGNITDTRLQAGPSITRVDRFATEAELGEPSTVTINFSRINQNKLNTTLTTDSGNLYPCYYDAQNNIVAMSLQDMKDTLIHPTIDLLTAGTTDVSQAGTYFIGTVGNDQIGDLVSQTQVYIDTRANTGAYSAGSIPEAQDQPTTITNYYVIKVRRTAPTYTAPLILRSDNDLQQYPETDFNTMLTNLINYTAESSTDGYGISYNLGTSGSGNTRGSGMVDTVLNGSGAVGTRFVNADDYRAQEFPNGTAVTAATYYLRINKS